MKDYKRLVHLLRNEHARTNHRLMNMAADAIEDLQKQVEWLEQINFFFGEHGIIDPVVGTSADSIPPACRFCSNHPSNGGSGICHCILGGIMMSARTPTTITTTTTTWPPKGEIE